MDGTTRQVDRRTLTPAVIAAALFTVACAAAAVTFVAARGGLQLPVAVTASQSPTATASAGPSPVATILPTTAPPSATAAGPSPVASPAPSAPVTTPAPTSEPTPAGTPDPLAALPGCPGIPGCYEYLIRRGDSLSGVASRYAIPVSVVLALNPEVTDPGTIVVGQILYLGRDPFLRLAPCPDRPDCSLYQVQPGDRLSTIAGRFGLTLEAVLAANPEVSDANAIRSGQLIRLPHPAV